jgi:hypothetical protein
MTVMSLQKFLRYSREQQDDAPRTLLVTVDDLRDMLGNFEDDRPIEIKLDYPKYQSITVNFFPQEDE